MEAANNNYANVEPIAQLRLGNGSLGYRSCLIVHSESDMFSPEDTAGRASPSTIRIRPPATWSRRPSSHRDVGGPEEVLLKVTFSGSHEASILAVANKKVEVASTICPTSAADPREQGSAGRAACDLVSKLIPNDPIVVRKDLPPSLKSAIQESLVSMKAKNPRPSRSRGVAVGVRGRR